MFRILVRLFAAAIGVDLPPRTIPLFKLESVASGRPDRGNACAQPMSEKGHKRTFSRPALYVR